MDSSANTMHRHPKKPEPAYLLFQNDVREAFRNQYPDQPYRVVLGKISEAWSNLCEEQKKVIFVLLAMYYADRRAS